MNSKSDCLNPTVLTELLEGGIDEPTLGALTKHLEDCLACQNVAKTLTVDNRFTETLRDDGVAKSSSPPLTELINRIKLIPQVESRHGIEQAIVTDQSVVHQLDEIRRVLEPAQDAEEIGRLGHYRILQVLGHGGMGAVFLAEDPKLGRRVALKVMLPRIANVPAARERFLREAKAAASLKNDHIVTIYQVDEFNGVPFLAMELLQGESLEQAIHAGRRFSIAETVRIACDVGRGLADAHEKGLVHRDIKPGNLWLEQTPDGNMRVKILDFGLARAEIDDVHITQFGTIVGTPAFMAPEQARADRAVDGRADLFSLGCVLYLMCTGDIPFKADTTVGTLMALALNSPIAPSQRNESVPAELSQLIMLLLEKDPSQRPKSAREVTRRLAAMERSMAVGNADNAMVPQTLLGVSKSTSGSVRSVSLPVRKSVGRGLKIATGLFAAALMFIAAEVLLRQTRDGRVVRIECNDPSIKVAFQGGELKVTGAYDQPVKLTPGKVDLKITKPQPYGKDFEFETDKLIIRKGDQIALKIEVLDDEVRIVQDGKGLIDSQPLPSGAEQFAAVIEAMKLANPGFDGAMAPVIENGRLVSLDFKTDNVTDLSPLRDLKHLRGLRMVGNGSPDNGISDLSPLQGLPLTGFYIYYSPRVTDLSPLKGIPLQELHVNGCPIADLTPLAGMPLRILWAWSWTGSDLSPLKGMQLTQLNIGGNGKAMDLTPLAGAPLEFLCLNASKVSDLSPLKGMPLKRLLCENTLVSDLSPIQDAKLTEFVAGGSQIKDFTILRDMPLTWVKFDILLERDLELLRDIKTLVRINDLQAVDFLREVGNDLGSRPVSPAFTNNIGMEFVQVPKGKAWLVRKVSETQTNANHETVFEDDFFMGMYEVTQEQWVKVMGSNPSYFGRNADGAEAVKILPDDVLKKLPVERVSWIDCQQFLKKLNELDSTPGWVYRLPTAAQWQYACRGGPMNDIEEAQYEFCTTERRKLLTIDDANTQHALGWNRPCRVGLFPPNPLGLYDMHGNVWEWCDDLAPWRDKPSRFVNGGGWNDPAADCGVSNIKQPTEPWTYYDLGLRVVRVPSKP